jgi:DNA-binding MarR family transcriptional regulator
MSLQATTWAWRLKVTPNEKIVLLSLADRSDEYYNCNPSFTGIIDDTGLTLDKVELVIKKLEIRGLIVLMDSPDSLRLKCKLAVPMRGD